VLFRKWRTRQSSVGDEEELEDGTAGMATDRAYEMDCSMQGTYGINGGIKKWRRKISLISKAIKSINI
jgi:hypothetical protein